MKQNCRLHFDIKFCDKIIVKQETLSHVNTYLLQNYFLNNWYSLLPKLKKYVM